MMEKIKELCVCATAGNEAFNKAHPWYCIFTVLACIGTVVWAVIDLVWRWKWIKKN